MTSANQSRHVHTVFLENITSRNAYWIAELYRSDTESFVVTAHGKLPYRGPVRSRTTRAFSSFRAAEEYFFRQVEKKEAGDYIKSIAGHPTPCIKVDFPVASAAATPAFSPPPPPPVQRMKIVIQPAQEGSVPFI